MNSEKQNFYVNVFKKTAYFSGVLAESVTGIEEPTDNVTNEDHLTGAFEKNMGLRFAVLPPWLHEQPESTPFHHENEAFLITGQQCAVTVRQLP